MGRMAIVVGVMVAGCGGGIETDLAGIYRIDTWTDNPTACTEGPSVLIDRGDTAMFLQPESLVGTDFLNAETCPDVATCRAWATGDPPRIGFGLVDGSDDDGWTGTGATAGSDGAGMCQGSRREFSLTGATTIQLEVRTFESTSYPPDGDGFCTTDDALEAAEGQPCSELEVITATYDSAI